MRTNAISAFVRFLQPFRLPSLIGALLICTPLRADDYHGVNAGAVVWDGRVIFTAERARAIADTGCRSVRINFRLDGQPQWNDELFKLYDEVVNAAARERLTILGVLANETVPLGQADWNQDPHADGRNEFVTVFARTARLLVERYGDRIHRWEIWNEPNCWSKPPNDPKTAGCTYMLPRVYARLLFETREALEAEGLLERHKLRLVSGGLLAHDIGGSFTTAMDYMKEVYDQPWWRPTATRPSSRPAERHRGAGKPGPSVQPRYPWDDFGYHVYINGGEPLSEDKLRAYLTDVRAMQKRFNDSAPILITEFGWNMASVSAELQRDNLLAAYRVFESLPDIRGTWWYQWVDESPDYQWGLMHSDGRTKPALEAFQSRQ